MPNLPIKPPPRLPVKPKPKSAPPVKPARGPSEQLFRQGTLFFLRLAAPHSTCARGFVAAHGQHTFTPSPMAIGAANAGMRAHVTTTVEHPKHAPLTLPQGVYAMKAFGAGPEVAIQTVTTPPPDVPALLGHIKILADAVGVTSPPVHVYASPAAWYKSEAEAAEDRGTAWQRLTNLVRLFAMPPQPPYPPFMGSTTIFDVLRANVCAVTPSLFPPSSPLTALIPSVRALGEFSIIANDGASWAAVLPPVTATWRVVAGEGPTPEGVWRYADGEEEHYLAGQRVEPKVAAQYAVPSLADLPRVRPDRLVRWVVEATYGLPAILAAHGEEEAPLVLSPDGAPIRTWCVRLRRGSWRYVDFGEGVVPTRAESAKAHLMAAFGLSAREFRRLTVCEAGPRGVGQ